MFFLRKILVIILFLVLIENKVKSKTFEINCSIVNSQAQKIFNEKFSKLINAKEKVLIDQSGILYDKLLYYNEREIIFVNNIYESYSVYNINSEIMTIYSSMEVINYECKKKER